ncbi:MAG: ferritin [Chloroflexota bacterium]|nr:ferritin [Chloroflexota bacterium]
MTLSPAVQEALNAQIKHEFDSAYIYLSMAAYCESANLPGFAHWLGVQAREEVEHAMKFYAFIHDRGGRVQLRALDQPPTEFGSILGVFEQALAHERKISGLINQLYGLAAGEQDYASQAFLQGFVTEQVEEEKITSQVVERLKLAGDSTHALLLVDREVGERQGEDA